MTLGNRRACALAFLTAFAALFLQVLVHRVISAKHFEISRDELIQRLFS